ncbi:hypothetical protein ACQ4PT_065982 [Festuca glaucescens]
MAPGGVELAAVLVSLEDGGSSLDAGYQAVDEGDDGNNEVLATDALETGDFDRARVHPKFLHTNATSHKWAFGAIAELLDNAVDEISNGATYVKVDKTVNSKDDSPMLVFQDGNGFKTSTVRLGADAVVFTRAICGSNVTLSVGLLSYTFLRKTVKDDIVIPMLDFQDQEGNIVPLAYGSQGDWDSSLKIMLDWSPFSSKEELLQQAHSSLQYLVHSPLPLSYFEVK